MMPARDKIREMVTIDPVVSFTIGYADYTIYAELSAT